eukprot:3553477-Rhodomonas_salina.1
MATAGDMPASCCNERGMTKELASSKYLRPSELVENSRSIALPVLGSPTESNENEPPIITCFW